MRYQRIKELCKANNITITGLEKELGFAKGSLSKIDKHLPSADKIKKIADKLKTTPEYILYGEIPEQKSKTGNVYYFDDKTAQLAQEMYQNPTLGAFMSATRKLTPKQFNVMQSMLTEFLRKDGEIDD